MLRLPLATGGLAAVGWAAPALAPIVPPVAAALRVPRRIDDQASIALTFDDGPHPEGTPAILERLADAEVKATFFLVGEQVDRNRELAAEIAAAGHGIALHCHRHRNQLRLTRRQLADDLVRGVVAITDATGVKPLYHRPPYGIFSHTGLALTRRHRLRPLLWSRWGHDWRKQITPTAIASEVTSDLRGGDVLLLHDADHYSAAGCWRNTVAAMEPILETIEARGLPARTL